MPSPLRRLFARRTPRHPRRTPRPPKLCEHDVASPRIHPGLDGVRIGQLSDIHVRGGVRPRRLEQAVEQMNALRPDFVVLTGDYVCVSAVPLPSLTATLRRLQVPAFATLGNHDHWCGAEKVRAALEEAGVDVLQNANRALTVRGVPLHLIGVDDSVTRHHDPEKAFAGVPEDATRIVLSHDPKSAEFLWRYNPALVLSGHTHGGQVYFKKLTPFISERIGVRYLAGFYEIKGSVLYVTRGLGAAVPVRFRAPTEVAHLTLRSTAARALAQAA